MRKKMTSVRLVCFTSCPSLGLHGRGWPCSQQGLMGGILHSLTHPKSQKSPQVSQNVPSHDTNCVRVVFGNSITYMGVLEHALRFLWSSGAVRVGFNVLFPSQRAQNHQNCSQNFQNHIYQLCEGGIGQCHHF